MFEDIARKLGTYSSGEVEPYVMHLIFVLYHSAYGRFPLLRDSFAAQFHECMPSLSGCETINEMKSIMELFFSAASEKIHDGALSSSGQAGTLIVSRTLQIIEKNLPSKDLCLNLIAEEIGLSANYIGVLFKAARGITIGKYIQDTRMELVAHYMKTTKKPLPQILSLCGMELNNYFYTAFKKHFGMSMSQYRLAMLDQAEEDNALS